MFLMMANLILGLKNGLDLPKSKYLHISAILKQIITSVQWSNTVEKCQNI